MREQSRRYAAKMSDQPDSHRKGVDIFVQSIKQEYGLDDHIINPVDIELDFCAAVAMPQTQLGLLQVIWLQIGDKDDEQRIEAHASIRET